MAEIPALILAKGSKIGERLREPRKGPVRDKDLGDLWRLMVVADPGETIRVIGEFVDDPEVGREEDDVARRARSEAAHAQDRRADPRGRWVTSTCVGSSTGSSPKRPESGTSGCRAMFSCITLVHHSRKGARATRQESQEWPTDSPPR